MSSENEVITKERLSKLPRRAIVAFAVRCARRVEPLLIQGFETWGNEELLDEVKQIDNGLGDLERWCGRGRSIDDVSALSQSLNDSARIILAGAPFASFAGAAAGVATDVAATAMAAYMGDTIQAAAAAAAVAAAAASGDATAAAVAIRRDISFLESAVAMTADGTGGWIDPTDEGPIGPIWSDPPPAWYREAKPEFDQFLGRTAASDRPAERLEWELDRAQKELEATRQQIVSAQARAESRQEEVARLEASFGKQSEALQKYEENLVAQREQLTRQQEHAAELQKRLSDAVSAAAEAQAARDLAEADAKKLELELASKQTRSFGDLWRDFRAGKIAWDDIRIAMINLVLWTLMSAAGFLVFITLSEISSRQQLESLISSELAHVRNELAKTDGPNKEASPLRKQLDHLEQGLKDVRRLVTIGATSQSMFAAEISERTRVSAPDETRKPNEGSALSWWDLQHFWSWSNSEFLLALVVSTCGGIGSLIAMIREDSRHKANSGRQDGRDRNAVEYGQLFMLGLSTGFLAFFIVRGGKAVFLLQGDSVSFPTNPYTTSFAGLIAGVFTERAYGLLMEAVTQLENKIRQVINDPPTKKPDPKPVDPPTP